MPLEEPLPTGDSIHRAFLRQVSRLPAAAQTALLVAAASDTSDLSVIVAAASQLDAETTALDTAEAAGLVRLSGLGVEFRHPLLRAAVYHSAPPPARRTAHRALAAALLQTGDTDRHAWQLAAATITPDEQVAQVLEQAGLRAQARGGHAAAARALHRAAQLSPTLTQRAHRLHAAAEACWFAGQLEHAVRMLGQALTLTPSPSQRADLQHLHGQIETWRGNMPAASRLLISEGEAIATADPEKVLRITGDSPDSITETPYP